MELNIVYISKIVTEVVNEICRPQINVRWYIEK